MTAFLGVEASLGGRSCIGPTAEDDRLSEAMAQVTGLADAVCRVLARRGVDRDREALEFLGIVRAHDLDHALEADVLVVIADLGLGGGREDDLGKLA